MTARFVAFLLVLSSGVVLAGDAEDFKSGVLPMLDKLCFDCHEPGISKGHVEFLDAEDLAGIAPMRETWRNVATQIGNRTMPPPDKPQPTDQERSFLVGWINSYLIKTACDAGPYAGYVTAWRLNRFDYDNTILDLLGVDLEFRHSLPIDGGAGEGFNNNGESLFLPPMLMERYLEAAQKIVDAAIVSPRLDSTISKAEFPALIPVYVEDSYVVKLRVAMSEPGQQLLELKVDGLPVRKIKFGGEKVVERRIDLKLGRGVHSLTLTESETAKLEEIQITQFEPKPDEATLTNHEAVIGLKLGEAPENPREHARQRLLEILRSAWRRPIEPTDIEPFLKLYDRAENRGDPFEECFKLALRGILVSPDFLFRIEIEPAGPEIQPLTDHELAVRLSYFIWSTAPDAELSRLADAGKLNHPDTLRKQVARMIDDPRSRRFAREFVGQWLGTKDVGGRIAPVTNNNQSFYTNEVARDMREEGVRLFHHILVENRPLLELVSADYTFLSRDLAEFYDVPDWKKFPDGEFKRVDFKNGRRGGIIGLGGVLALTSHENKTSPVLRGAWVFDTLIGSPVPPPPPNIPDLIKAKDGKKLTDREQLALHRADASCSSCHNLIDPIGFALQNYDRFGRWRDKQEDKPIDASGQLPGGEKFRGLPGLKQQLLATRQPEIERHFARKLLGYALGRNLVDRDDCTITGLVSWMQKNDHSTRGLIEEIVLSTPFRNRQQIDDAPENSEK
ncbi:MAG: hypothetical protein ACI8UO_000637 [Verrucomicrobiales bacterium]|jgi:hypothetical protein